MTLVGAAADCHGHKLHRHDRVELELTPEDAGVVLKLEQHGETTWATVQMDNGEERLIETWRLEGPR